MRLLFALATLLGAALLFWSEPMVGKLVLPQLGGTPAVWNTCMLFFQAALLVGYVYAHLLTTRLAPRTQALVHVGVAALAMLALPLALSGSAGPLEHDHPVPWLLGQLLRTVGPPFFVLSTSAPLLQRWFLRTSGRDPYPLYVASNAGSLVALLAFPLLLEPRFALGPQGDALAAGYAGYVLLLTACAAALWQSPLSAPLAAGSEPGERLTLGRRLRWMLLAFAPSSLMLGATTSITTDVAPIPLLWVVPLALYLLTFILAFAAPKGGGLRLLTPLMVLAAGVQLFLLVVGYNEHLAVTIGVHLASLFLAARVCHGALAADRPHPDRLTEFYVWMSAGGALGGLFNGLLAPRLFSTVAEYPLALLLACALAPAASAAPRRFFQRPAAAALLGAAALLVWWLTRGREGFVWATWIAVFLMPAVLLFSSLRRPWRFVLGAAPVLLATLTVGMQTDVLWRSRSFFGVHRVTRHLEEGRTAHLLAHGATQHGMQFAEEDAALRLMPLLYYHPQSPSGLVFQQMAERSGPLKVALVGLGVGSLAGYGRPGDAFTFYEIDPEVVRLANDSGLFTYLADTPAQVSVVLGDARLRLAESDERYDLIVLDAFSADAIPVHLLTREAVERVYLPRLADGGRLLVHVSNRYLHLDRVVAAVAGALELPVLFAHHAPPTSEGRARSTWMLLGRSEADLLAIEALPPWRKADPSGEKPWTDDHSNLLSVFDWSR